MSQLLATDKIGAQLYTVRDFTQTPEVLRETLEKISKIGYKSVQMSAVAAMEGENPSVSPESFRKMIDDNGLICPGAHISLESLRDNFAQELHKLKTVGCPFVAVGYIQPAIISDADASKKFISDAIEVANKYAGEGIHVGLHNHDHDCHFIDISIAGTSLNYELDVYWAAKAGIPPSEILARHSGKVGLIHLKDMPESGQGFAAVGEGTLDFEPIIASGLAAGTKYFVVEQDVCPRDPFDCLRSSFEFLTKDSH